MKHTFLRIGMVFVALCCSLIAVELLLRIFSPDIGRLAWSEGEGDFFQLHPVRVYGLRPSSSFPPGEKESRFYRTDAFGLRFNPLPPPEADNAKTILMIGDSFTFGKGVSHEEAYPARVQALLSAQGIHTTVLNAGVPGYGIDQEYQYLMDDLLPKHTPDVIVWNLNANDVDDTNKSCLYVLQGDALTQVSGKRNVLYLQGVIVRQLPAALVRSRTFRFGTHAVNTLIGSDRFTFGCSVPIRGSRTLIQQTFRNKLARYVSEVQSYAAAHGMKLVITLMPFEYYFDAEHVTDEIFSDYEAISQSIHTIFPEVLDLNALIARESDPQLLALRTHTTPAIAKPAESVLGTSSGSLRETLFLAEQNPFDGAHLSVAGNDRIAGLVAGILYPLLTN